MGWASRESGLRQTVAVVLDVSIPAMPNHTPALAADPIDSVLGSLHQWEPMQLTGGSGLERRLGQAATGTATPAALVRNPPPVVDPPEVNLGMPQQEIDVEHLDPEAHRVQQADPVDKVAQPKAAMAKLEQEHRAPGPYLRSVQLGAVI
jgi:hypothetical protein